MDNDKDDNFNKNNTFELCTSSSPTFTCPDGQEISPPTPTPTPDFAGPSGTKNEPFLSVKYHQKPRKKRTKLVKIDEHGVQSGGISKPKSARKPDPDAPKITKPCTECGKKFWSWKALFGHMRCHPEREWRGINPPPNFRQPHQAATTSRVKPISYWMSEEDHEVASCLLMLANASRAAAAASESPTVTTAACSNATYNVIGGDADENGGAGAGVGPGSSSGLNFTRFECSSCKKVFGSHQALGGHRASHKNVKGCFAITRNDGEEEERIAEGEVKENLEEEDKMLVVFGHKCSICLRVFSSGQALGGHKRCHWEKGDEPSGLTQDFNGFLAKEGSGFDLNLPAPVEVDSSSCSYSSGLALDLRLGL